MSDPIVRDGVLTDLDAVVAIYDREVREGYATFETEPADRVEWRHKLEGPEPFVVGEVDGLVVGMAYATEFRPRPAYHLTRETSVYLSPAGQGRRLGTRLYGALLTMLRASGTHTAVALVSLPNDASLRLHDRCGFVATGTMREVGDKFGRLIDVTVLQAML